MIIDGVKYSCESCIKGHRQANCTHADRPLREIQKRGRPVTACAECRELRRATNSHRTCVHTQDKVDTHEVLLKTLPNGAKDLQSISLVRRPSSTKSHGSVSSAPSTSHRTHPAGPSASSVASEEDLATVGRKKSVSRATSVSRRSSSAKEKKPHDLAHGHFADHPTHVSAAYSPYPHHTPKEHHHHHIPSPLAHDKERGEGGSNKPSPSGSAGVAVKTEAPILALPPLPALPQSASDLVLPQLPTLRPQEQFQLPDPHPLAPAPPAFLPELATSVPGLSTPQLTNEQLASAFFFRDFPPQAVASSSSASASPSNPSPQHHQPASEQPLNPDYEEFERFKASLEGGSGFDNAMGDLSYSSLADYRLSTTLPSIDSAVAAYVLGPEPDRPAVSLAPMYGSSESFFSAPAPDPPAPLSTSAPSDSGFDFSSHAFTGPAPPADPTEYRNPVDPVSSAASSDIFDLGGGAHPAVYGYPLEPVSSNYSGYESGAPSVAQSVSATSALERLDLSVARGQTQTPSSSAASQQPTPDAVTGQTDLDGILEWLASSTAAGVLPPPPSSSVAGAPGPVRQDSRGSGYASTGGGSGYASAWPSAPPSVVGQGVGDWSGVEDSSEGRESPAPGPAPTRLQFKEAEREDDEVAERRKRRPRNADLEMFRSTTITCADAAFSSSTSPDLSKLEEDADAAEEGGDYNFTADDLELDKFGVDEEWFRRLGLRTGGGAGVDWGGAGGEGDEFDDGYEEDDEASVVGRQDDDRGWEEKDEGDWRGDDEFGSGVRTSAHEPAIEEEDEGDEGSGAERQMAAEQEEQAHDRGGMWWS
ncbi:copper-fist transcription factor [Rhodotorula toruloides]|uniref:Copper-fist transcription factor n=1 Tax=Rhodotorula toruloides TaxID=5286 RepID=A0A511KSK7_RHOTO|nr:copper-fist transcription factor [Rhodotorula toruloides]